MKHKGFTLSELMVTLAVSGVILVSIFAMIVSVSSFNRIRNESAAVNEELSLAKTRLTDWFSKNDGSTTPTPTVSESGEQLTFGDSVAKFDSLKHEITLDGISYPTDYIDNITFEQNDADKNLVKCTVSYRLAESTESYVFMLLKRSINS